MRLRFPLMLLTAQAALLAQMGPYPGGGYPPGQYPGPMGGGGIPFPWPHKHKNKKGGGDAKGDAKNDEALIRSSGKLQKIDASSITLALPDGRVLDYHRDAKTKFYSELKEGEPQEIKDSQFKPGDEISVDATQDDQGYLSARNVYLEKSAPAAAASAPSQPAAEAADKRPPVEATADAPPPAPREADDPGPPTLKRGAAPRRAADSEEPPAKAPAPNRPAVTVARNTPPPEVVPAAASREQTDAVLEKARRAALTFSERLPDYVCKEFMARFQSTSHPVDWQPIDVVSTEIVYKDGHERYRNLAVNGKPVHKEMEQLSGSWSTGEFASMLLDLFSPATNADFYVRGDSSASGMDARVYNFTVRQPNSHWHVQVASQSMDPAYKGSVWIDPQSGRVLRIEIQARALPQEFPMDTVESAVDYAKVRIGEGEFLLPTHAETLSCQRGTSNCSRNTIDFRNYHKYEADSSITFGSSN